MKKLIILCLVLCACTKQNMPTQKVLDTNKNVIGNDKVSNPYYRLHGKISIDFETNVLDTYTFIISRHKDMSRAKTYTVYKPYSYLSGYKDKIYFNYEKNKLTVSISYLEDGNHYINVLNSKSKTVKTGIITIKNKPFVTYKTYKIKEAELIVDKDYNGKLIGITLPKTINLDKYTKLKSLILDDRITRAHFTSSTLERLVLGKSFRDYTEDENMTRDPYENPKFKQLIITGNKLRTLGVFHDKDYIYFPHNSTPDALGSNNKMVECEGTLKKYKQPILESVETIVGKKDSHIVYDYDIPRYFTTEQVFSPTILGYDKNPYQIKLFYNTDRKAFKAFDQIVKPGLNKMYIKDVILSFSTGNKPIITHSFSRINLPKLWRWGYTFIGWADDDKDHTPHYESYGIRDSVTMTPIFEKVNMKTTDKIVTFTIANQKDSGRRFGYKYKVIFYDQDDVYDRTEIPNGYLMDAKNNYSYTFKIKPHKTYKYRILIAYDFISLYSNVNNNEAEDGMLNNIATELDIKKGILYT